MTNTSSAALTILLYNLTKLEHSLTIPTFIYLSALDVNLGNNLSFYTQPYIACNKLSLSLCICMLMNVLQDSELFNECPLNCPLDS